MTQEKREKAIEILNLKIKEHENNLAKVQQELQRQKSSIRDWETLPDFFKQRFCKNEINLLTCIADLKSVYCALKNGKDKVQIGRYGYILKITEDSILSSGLRYDGDEFGKIYLY